MSNLHSGVDEPAVTEIRGVLPKGASLRNYEVLSVLGQGAFGITYLARDVTLDREVAIKEYLPVALALREEGNTVAARSTNTAPDFVTGRDRFLDEARTLAKLDRVPSVVRVLDFLAANGTAYMVMALVEGETLETRISRLGKLDSDAVEKLLWSLIDGLEQVHASGYLHRDIKPANILLDVQGNPTLIDFGAARAALAGSSVAMTAIFTPGYAAPEQFTSAKQGPWTDIYGVAATLYHAIAGHPPPSAFERLLDDEYEPLTRLLPAAFSPGMLVGIDAGLSVRAAERPQSIAGWRTIISQAASAGDAATTVALGRRPDRTTTTAISHAATTAPDLAPVPVKAAQRGAGLWAGAAAVVLVLAGGGYYVATSSLLGPPRAPLPVVTAAATETSKAQDAEAQQKADAGQALRREIAEETRRQIEAERAEQRRIDEEVRQKTEAAKESADAEAEAKRKLEADDKVAAEANENALHLSPLDRRHIQVALTGLGFDTADTHGALTPRTREMIASWQKARNYAATGFLTGVQNQALLREAAPAVAKYDDDQKRFEDEKKKTDAAVKASPAPVPAAPVPAPIAAAPNVASAVSRSGPDGEWRGIMHCTPSRFGPEISVALHIVVSGGSGTWVRPGSGPGTMGNQSISLMIEGSRVVVTRVFVPNNRPGATARGTMSARLDGNMIVGAGPEANGGGRTCDIRLTRAP